MKDCKVINWESFVNQHKLLVVDVCWREKRKVPNIRSSIKVWNLNKKKKEFKAAVFQKKGPRTWETNEEEQHFMKHSNKEAEGPATTTMRNLVVTGGDTTANRGEETSIQRMGNSRNSGVTSSVKQSKSGM